MSPMMLLNRDFLLNGPLPAVLCGVGKGGAQSVRATDSSR
jgi:hypothetical protein